MALQNRLGKLERKHCQAGIAFIILAPGETEQQALQRCYPGDKPKLVIYLDKFDLDA